MQPSSAARKQLPLHSLVVSVTEPTIVGEDAQYKVSLQDPDRPAVSVHRVNRTYKDLKPVIKKLASMNPDPPLPSIPKTKVFGALEDDFLQERCSAIEMWANAVCANRFLVKDIDFLEIIGYEEYQKLRGNAASNFLEKSQVNSVPAFLSFPRMSDREADLQAARGWLRSSPYSFIKALPELNHPSILSHKTHLLVQDDAGIQYVLSVVPIGPTAPVDLKGEKLKSLQRLLTTLDRQLFAPLANIATDEHRAYCVRLLAREGSLMDALNTTPQNVLEPGTKKYPCMAPIAVRHLRKWGRKILTIMQACAQYNIPLPHLSLGNLLISEQYGIVLGDMECLVLGCTRFPATNTPLNDDGEPCATIPDGAEQLPKTNFDILRFGLVLYQLALGKPLDANVQSQLLCCQGDPFEVKLENEDNGEAEEDGAKPAVKKVALNTTFPDVPDPVRNILYYIFHPTIPADIRVLLHHSFFANPETDGKDSDGIVAPPIKFKKKDLALISEVVTNWRQELDDRAQTRKKRAEERERMRELKKRGKSGPGSHPTSPKSTSISPSTSPPPPTSLMSSGSGAQQAAVGPPPTSIAAPPAPLSTAASTAPPIPQPTATSPPPKASPPPPVAPPPKAPPPPPPPGKTSISSASSSPTASPPPPAPPAGKVPPPPPPPKKAPPSSGTPSPPPDGARNALLDEIRRGTNKTFRGD